MGVDAEHFTANRQGPLSAQIHLPAGSPMDQTARQLKMNGLRVSLIGAQPGQDSRQLQAEDGRTVCPCSRRKPTLPCWISEMPGIDGLEVLRKPAKVPIPP